MRYQQGERAFRIAASFHLRVMQEIELRLERLALLRLRGRSRAGRGRRLGGSRGELCRSRGCLGWSLRGRGRGYHRCVGDGALDDGRRAALARATVKIGRRARHDQRRNGEAERPLQYQRRGRRFRGRCARCAGRDRKGCKPQAARQAPLDAPLVLGVRGARFARQIEQAPCFRIQFHRRTSERPQRDAAKRPLEKFGARP